MTEKEFQNFILEWLTAQGVCCWPVTTTAIFNKAKNCYMKPKNKHHIVGISDILGFYNGKFFAIELKRPKFSKKINNYVERKDEELLKMASPDQINFIEMVKRNGHVGFFADSISRIKIGLDL